MILASKPADPATLKAIFDPRRLLRWVFIGRLCLASAIFIAAVRNWARVDSDQTLVASLATFPSVCSSSFPCGSA